MDEDLDLKTRLSCMAYALSAQHSDKCVAVVNDAIAEIERLRPLAEKWIARHRPPHDVNMFYFGDDLSPLDCVEPDPEVESVVNKHFWELI